MTQLNLFSALTEGGYDPDRLLFLNMGLGQDSAAIAVLYCEGKLPAEYYTLKPYFVFADTGAEMPETYEWMREHFIPYLERYGHTLHILEPGGKYHHRRTGRVYPDIRTAFMNAKHPSFPTRKSPRCTENSKAYPLAAFRDEKRRKWCGRNANQQTRAGFKDWVVIGIAADETHRAHPAPEQNWEARYPLIDLGLDRGACREVIRAAGLAVPMKSGCYLCPFAPVWHYWWLMQKHPQAFAKVEEMEQKAVQDRTDRKLAPNYILGRLGPVRQAALHWHKKNPTETVETVERRMYDKAYAVNHGGKADQDDTCDPI